MGLELARLLGLSVRSVPLLLEGGISLAMGTDFAYFVQNFGRQFECRIHSKTTDGDVFRLFRNP